MSQRLQRMLALVREKRPQFVILVKQDVPLMRAAGFVLRFTTPTFMTHYTTVIGDHVYLPRPIEEFEPDRLAVTLAHELIHQLDMAEFGLGFYLGYALLPLPVGRSARAHWERRGYAVDMMIGFEEGGEERLERILQWLTGVFSGSSYGWMRAGRRSARAYLEVVAEPIRRGELQQQSPYDEILLAWRGQGSQLV